MLFTQELQQEVGSLLLFRQAVLAALPHLSVAAVSPGSGGSGVGKDLHHHHPVGGSGSSGTAVGRSGSSSQTPTTTPLAVQTSWARRKHAAGYPPSSLSTDEAAQGSSSGGAHGLHKIQQPPQKTTGKLPFVSFFVLESYGILRFLGIPLDFNDSKMRSFFTF